MNDRRVLVVVAVMAATLLIVTLALLVRPTPPPAPLASPPKPAGAQAVASHPAATREAPSAESAPAVPTATPSPAREYRVFGRVLMPDGSPAEGATVSLDWRGGLEQSKPGEARVAVQTGADGAFDLRAPTNYFFLRAAKPGFASVSLTVHLQEGDTYQQDLTLGTEARLAGRVVRREGGTDTPLAGVAVEAMRPRDAADASTTRYNQASYVATATDEAGNFALGGLQFGEHLVRARLADGGAIYQTLHATTENALFVFEPSTFAEVSGIVVDAAGAPVAGARVGCWVIDPKLLGGRSAFGEVARRAPEPTITNAEGRFSAPGIESGLMVQLSASVDKVRTRTTPTVTAGLDSTNVRLVVEGGWTVNGRVVHAQTNEPLAGVEIVDASLNYRYPNGKPPADLEIRTTSAADGTFTLAISPESARPAGPNVLSVGLAIEKPGFRVVQDGAPSNPWSMLQPANQYSVLLGADTSVVEATIKLMPSVRLAGRVRRADGGPLKGGRIAALVVKPPVAVGDGSTMYAPGGMPDQCSLEAGGAFALNVLPSETYRLSISVDGYGQYSPPHVTVPAEGVTGLDIVLPRHAAIEGIVVDRAHKPVDGIKVSRGPNDQAAVTTGSEGSFRFDNLVPGQIDLMAEGPGHTRGSVTVRELAAGETKRDVRIVVDKAVVFGGRVLDPQKRPVAKAELSLRPKDIDIPIKSFATDESGEFLEKELPETEYRELEIKAGVEKYGFLPEQFVIGRADNVLVLEHRAMCTIIVSVVDKTTKEPVSGLEINSRNPGGLAEVEDAELGILRIDNVSAGAEFSVTVKTPRHPSQVISNHQLQLPPSIEAGAVLQRVVEITAKPTIRGRVVRAGDQAPVAGVGVTATRDMMGTRRGPTPNGLPTTTTGADGAFTLETIDLKAAAVAFDPPAPLVSRVIPLHYNGGPDYELGDIALDAGMTLRVKVVDGDGRGLPGVGVTAHTIGGMGPSSPTQGTTDAQGLAVLEDLPRSQFFLQAEGILARYNSLHHRPADGETIILSGGTAKLRVAIRRNGVPVEGAWKVEFERRNVDESMYMMSGKAKAHDPETGFILFEGLAPGKWSCQPSAGSDNSRPMGLKEKAIELSNGQTTEVVFDISTGGIAGRVVDEQGRAVAKATVHAQGRLIEYRRTTSGAGLFEFVGLEDGTYTMRAETSNDLRSEKTNVTVANGQPVEGVSLTVRSPGFGRVHIVAVSGQTGAPATIQRVVVSRDTGGRQFEPEFVPQPDGSWMLERVPAEKIQLRVEAIGLSTEYKDIVVEPGQTQRIETTHVPVGRLEWTLVDERGAPANVSAEVSLIGDDGQKVRGYSTSGSQIQWESLRPGRYRGETWKDISKRYGRASVDFEIRANETTRLRTVVPPPAPTPPGTPSP